MGLLKSSANEEEPDFENDSDRLEEEYQKLFMKVGRDFVHKDDFQSILTDLYQVIGGLLEALDPLGLINVNTESGAGAMKRALEYKTFLEIGYTGSKDDDLLKLDEDEE